MYNLILDGLSYTFIILFSAGLAMTGLYGLSHCLAFLYNSLHSVGLFILLLIVVSTVCGFLVAFADRESRLG